MSERVCQHATSADGTCAGPEFDEFVNAIQIGIPESWDDDTSGESICLDYIRTIERRIVALGGSLEKYPEDEDVPRADPGVPPPVPGLCRDTQAC